MKPFVAELWRLRRRPLQFNHLAQKVSFEPALVNPVLLAGKPIMERCVRFKTSAYEFRI